VEALYGRDLEGMVCFPVVHVQKHGGYRLLEPDLQSAHRIKRTTEKPCPTPTIPNPNHHQLVGGLEHDFFSIQLGISSSQLTNSYFSEGYVNHQPVMFATSICYIAIENGQL